MIQRPEDAASHAHIDAPSLALLTPAMVVRVRQVIRAFHDGRLREVTFGEAGRLAAEEGRRRGLRAEQMLVMLKRDWASLDEVRRLSSPEARDLLEAFITRCIHAYYASGADGTDGTDGAERSGDRAARPDSAPPSPPA